MTIKKINEALLNAAPYATEADPVNCDVVKLRRWQFTGEKVLKP